MRSVINLKNMITYAAAIVVWGCVSTGTRVDHLEDAGKTPGVAQIVFKTQSHDFGTAQYSTAGLTHSFVFTNTGTAALLIKNVKAG